MGIVVIILVGIIVWQHFKLRDALKRGDEWREECASVAREYNDFLSGKI